MSGHALHTKCMMQQIKLENFLGTENLISRERLHTIKSNSQEIFKKGWIIFSATSLPEGQFGSGHWYVLL